MVLKLYRLEAGVVLYETTPFAREMELHMMAVCMHASFCTCLHTNLLESQVKQAPMCPLSNTVRVCVCVCVRACTSVPLPLQLNESVPFHTALSPDMSLMQLLTPVPVTRKPVSQLSVATAATR